MTLPHFEELTLWPNHLKPLPDELASSWMIRLAHAHGYKSEQLCRILLGRSQPMWNRDIDKQLSVDLKNALMRVTAISEQRIDMLELVAYEGVLSEHVSTSTMSQWILPLGVWHRKRRMPSLMCCPMCLATDAVPYFRRSWRLSFVTVCSKHHVELLDECPKCFAPITPHRVDVGKAGLQPRKNILVKCANCRNDFRSLVPQKVNQSLAEFTRTLEQTVSLGYADWANVSGMHSLLFFKGLRAVLKVILAKDLCVSSVANDFERIPILTRRRAVTVASQVFNGTPERLIDFARRVSARYFDFVGKQSSPYWLLTQLRVLQRSQHPKRSACELAAVAAAVEQRVGRATQKNARESFGVHMAAAGHPSFRNQVSDDAFEALLASLDHSIARSCDFSKKAALMQDKVMFSITRLFGWGSTRLSLVNMSEIAKVLPSNPRLSHESLWFASEPLQIEVVRARVWWYIEKVRPRIKSSGDCARVFLNAKTGHQLTDSAISARFKRAVSAAYLTASISNMPALKIHS